jgi:hypothetical protein
MDVDFSITETDEINNYPRATNSQDQPQLIPRSSWANQRWTYVYVGTAAESVIVQHGVKIEEMSIFTH